MSNQSQICTAAASKILAQEPVYNQFLTMFLETLKAVSIVTTKMRMWDEEDSIRLANESEYGLGAGVFTQNIERAHRVAAEIESGMVWIWTWLVRPRS